ncbi:MAG TPA: hypothetical protein VGP07_00715 [Polyangia bacterium]
MALLGACAGPPHVPDEPSRHALVPGAERTVATQTTLPFAGARCSGGTCRCRNAEVNEPETSPPPAGMKRLELRMSAAGGAAAVDISGLGTFAVSGENEACAYVDVPAGSTHDVEYVAKETVVKGGIAPRLKIVEYGPKGPFWYDMLLVTCDGPGGKCDRNAAEAWGAFVKERKRGRMDPCGSGVVTKLVWDTAGGQSERDGGLFRDYTVRFTMEVKKFATQFAPGSTECVPK